MKNLEEAERMLYPRKIGRVVLLTSGLVAAVVVVGCKANDNASPTAPNSAAASVPVVTSTVSPSDTTGAGTNVNASAKPSVPAECKATDLKLSLLYPDGG
ncbi:MAG: hypothetical protein ACREP9_13175, partial [Candidatus Dormibacteraceae bacterium]